MNKEQNAKYNMYKAVMLVCNANQSVWQNLASFGNAFNDFETNITTLQDAFEEQQTNIKGYTTQKQSSRFEMAEQAMLVKNAIQAYATDTNNPLLYNSINYRASKLKYEKASEAQLRAQNIYDAGIANLANLGDYGITAQTLSDLQTMINTFNSLIATPRNITSQISVATKNIKTAEKAIDNILKNRMDKLMNIFKLTAPDFYKQYFADRKTISSTQSTKLRATVENNRGEAIPNAEIYIINSGLSGITDENGFCRIKNIPFGNYEVAVTSSGGTQTFGPLRFKSGKSLTKHFVIANSSSPSPQTIKTVETIAVK